MTGKPSDATLAIAYLTRRMQEFYAEIGAQVGNAQHCQNMVWLADFYALRWGYYDVPDRNWKETEEGMWSKDVLSAMVEESVKPTDTSNMHPIIRFMLKDIVRIWADDPEGLCQYIQESKADPTPTQNPDSFA